MSMIDVPRQVTPLLDLERQAPTLVPHPTLAGAFISRDAKAVQTR